MREVSVLILMLICAGGLILACVFFGGGCDKGANQGPKDATSAFTCRGHNYLQFGALQEKSIVHDPDCPCGIRK
jgi:hypothetical protein